MSRLPTGLAAGTALLSAVLAAPAAAAPVTVDLRVEGAASTLFEAPVTTGVRAFRFTGGPRHRCDGRPPAGTATSPQITRGAVLATAERRGLTVRGQWSATYGSPSFTSIAGEDVGYDAATKRYLVEYLNGRPSSAGACGEAVAAGDEVLFAYGTGEERVLELRGGRTVKPGRTVTLRVRDAATGKPVRGALVGGARTGARGRARVLAPADRGHHLLKATKAGAIRSNAIDLCVLRCRGAAPGPGARDETAPAVTLGAPRDGARYAGARAPRLLRGRVAADPSGLRAVRLRLARRVDGRCSAYFAAAERFRRVRCGRAPAFGAGRDARWSYLLPERLAPGTYVLHAVAVDGAGNRGRARARFVVA
jgi:hypothetical protein